MDTVSEPLAIFTNRRKELAVLQGVVDSLREGQPYHVALFGVRRIGKTWLMRRHIQEMREVNEAAILPVYINLESICTSPEVFAQRYIGLVCFWAVAGCRGDVDDYLTATRLLRACPSCPDVVPHAVGSILDELERRTPDYHFLVHTALTFPARLAAEMGIRLVLFLDEFPELVTLGNYPQVGDPLKLFRDALQSRSNTAYVIAGSAVSAMERLTKDHHSPLFLQFEMLPLGPFEAKDSRALAWRLLPDSTPEVVAAIARYSAGYPFYIAALCRRLERLREGGVEALTDETVRWAFVLETLSWDGRIYSYCRYLHDVSLHKARGYGILKTILQTLAVEEGLTLSEVARAIRKGTSPTREYLRALMEVDLIVKRERRYYFRDPVLRFWVAYTGRGVELDSLPRPDDLRDLLQAVTERFQATSTELGRAKESEVRELLRLFAGQEVPGELLGSDAPVVRLPTFTEVSHYRSPDGQVEVDALAENGERWAVEVKWRGRLVGRKEVEKLLSKAGHLKATPWLVAKVGFTEQAAEYGRQHGVYLSTAADLENLRKLLISAKEAS